MWTMAWHLVIVISLSLLCSCSCSQFIETKKPKVCYPGETYDFVKGLLLPDLSPGVTHALDSKSGLAYEIDGKKAKVIQPLEVALQQGQKSQIKYQQLTWLENYSIVLNVRLWTERADILHIYSGNLRHLFGIVAFAKYVALKFRGKTVKIARWNARDFKFHRIILTVLGNKVYAKVSLPDGERCSSTRVTRLKQDANDRRIEIASSIIVVGRITTKGKIVPPLATIQEILFRSDVHKEESCAYKISCPTTAPPTVSTTTSHQASTEAIHDTLSNTTSAAVTASTSRSEISPTNVTTLDKPIEKDTINATVKHKARPTVSTATSHQNSTEAMDDTLSNTTSAVTASISPTNYTAP